MAKQVRTPAEIAQVTNDFDTAQFTFDLSLDLRGNTLYATTDPSVSLSTVNIRHLNNSRAFRGLWVTNPVDGDTSDNVADEPIPYTSGQVVVGSDNLLYMLSSEGRGTTNPTTENQTDWILLGERDRLTAEFTSDPPVIEAPLFAGNHNIEYTVHPPAPYAFTSGTPPTVIVTPSLDSAPTVNAGGRVTATIPNQTTPGTEFTFTTQGTFQVSDENVLSSTVDTPVIFSDQRMDPEITLDSGNSNRISRVRVNPTDTLPTVSYNVALAPSGTSVAAGTAYNVSWIGTTGTTAASPNAMSGRYTTPTGLVNNTNVVFSFRLNASNPSGQIGVPVNQTFPVNVYSPWFWSFSENAPTALSGMTEGILTGETQGNDFPILNDSTFQVTGTVNTIQNLWLAVPTSVNRNITLNTGIAFMQSTTDGTLSGVTVAGGGIGYTLHRFRIGLVQSPTIFRITSIPNS